MNQRFRESIRLQWHRFWLLAWLAITMIRLGGSAGAVSPDVVQDGIVDFKDLFLLGTHWYEAESYLDQNADGIVNQSDLLLLRSKWHRRDAAENPYRTGRVVGIYSVIHSGEETFVSDELEFEITEPNRDVSAEQSAAKWNRPFHSSSLTVSSQSAPLPEETLPNNQEMFDFFTESVVALNEHAQTHRAHVPSSPDIWFGHPSDEIGTFGGLTLWIGWAGSFSETYTPESETYAWVVYFAPEAMYVALQEAKSTYSSVDVFAAISGFFGGLISPHAPVLRKSYLDQLYGVAITFSAGILDVGPTLFRVGKTSNLARGFQYNYAKSVSFKFVPIPTVLGVSLDYEAKVTAGFYPIIAWDTTNLYLGSGNPANAITAKLEDLSTPKSESFYDVFGGAIARKLLPFMRAIRTPDPASPQDSAPPGGLAEYFGEFFQAASTSSQPANTSIDNLIEETERWLETENVDQLAEKVRDLVTRSLSHPLLLQEVMKDLRAGTQLSFELGERHGYDAAVQEGRRDDNKIFANCVETVRCRIHEPCALEVTADEIAALFPGKRPADFEGVELSFDFSTPGGGTESVTLRNGTASYTFTPTTDTTSLIGIKINPSEKTDGKYVELCRREVVIEPHEPEGVFLYGVDRVRPESPVTLSTALVDEYGIPSGSAAMVQFFDYRDQPLGPSIQASKGLASISVTVEPTIPRIEGFGTTLVGYTEEDARTGYWLGGRGFSRDADVKINGTSVNDMDGWVWEIISSKEILFLPPDDQPLGISQIQVVNPYSIPSNVYQYTP